MKKLISCLLVFILIMTTFVFAVPIKAQEASKGMMTTTLASTKKPVILVGGVGGSKLFKDLWLGIVDELWFDENEVLFSYSDSFLDPTAFTKSGTPADSGVRTLRRSNGYTSSDISGGLIEGIETSIFIAGLDIFDSLISALKADGYVVGTNLFAAPYDWRKDLNESYQTLNEVIEIAKQRSGWDKVDIVAHSMGGLFTKRYLYESAANRSKVDKFITLGTPYLGSPNAAWTTYVGDNFSILGGFLGVNPSKVRQLVANFPAAYQLYPSKKYYEKVINANNGALYTFDGIRYMSYFIENNYDMNGNYSYYDHLTYDQINNAVYRWNGSGLYPRNAQYHDLLDTVSLHNLGVKHYIIAGRNVPTLYVMRANGGSSVSFEDLRFGDGDGTVPYASAIDTGITATAKYYVTNVDHGNIVSSSASVNTIKSILSYNTTSALMMDEKASITSYGEDNYIGDDETELSGAVDGLLIMIKADEMPVVYKKNNNKMKIGAGEKYKKYKDMLENGLEATEEAKKELGAEVPQIIENTIGNGSYMQQYGDIYVIYLPEKEDYTIKLKGSKKAAIQIREFTASQEKTLDTIEDFSKDKSADEITLEYEHSKKKIKNKK